jgi:integrase
VLKLLKTACLYARKKGSPINPDIDDYKTMKEDVDNTWLTFAELDTLEGLNITEPHLDVARDWLLISCDTGQRVSDFMRFSKKMVRIEKGKKLIEFTQTKTKKIVAVPASKRVLKIIEKWGGEFPRRQTEQNYNDYVKIVGEMAGFTELIPGSISVTENGVTRKVKSIYEKWRLISSHIGRRSFATNYYGIIPTSLLISATGHKTENQFLKYIKKTDTQKAMQLADFF